MVRVGGLEYSCAPLASMGKRIDNMRLNGKPLDADKKYKVAGWAPVAEGARGAGNTMIWEVAEQWLKASGGRIAQRTLNTPQLQGVLPNPGVAAA